MRQGSITPIYRVWYQMRNRCKAPGNPQYKDYGGRGISICSEWDDYPTFERWALANGYKPGLVFDREDNNGNYTPENCRWVTHSVSSTNRRSTRFVTIHGETKSYMDWSKDSRCRVPYMTLRHRLRSGWLPECALSTKSQRKWS